MFYFIHTSEIGCVALGQIMGAGEKQNMFCWSYSNVLCIDCGMRDLIEREITVYLNKWSKYEQELFIIKDWNH